MFTIEDILVKIQGNPAKAFSLIKDILDGERIPEIEAIIKESSIWAHEYARDVIKGRWPEAEAKIFSDPASGRNYIYKAPKGPCPEIEDSIKDLGWLALHYAMVALKGRFPKAEPAILSNNRSEYLAFLRRKNYNTKDKLRWIEEGLTKELVEVLNHVGMKPEVQERILQLRPDLAGQIKGLSKYLRCKYRYELELSRVDL
jgi:hypothetical protein